MQTYLKQEGDRAHVRCGFCQELGDRQPRGLGTVHPAVRVIQSVGDESCLRNQLISEETRPR